MHTHTLHIHTHTHTHTEHVTKSCVRSPAAQETTAAVLLIAKLYYTHGSIKHSKWHKVMVNTATYNHTSNTRDG